MVQKLFLNKDFKFNVVKLTFFDYKTKIYSFMKIFGGHTGGLIQCWTE